MAVSQSKSQCQPEYEPGQEPQPKMTKFWALVRLGRLKFIPYSSMLALMGALSRNLDANSTTQVASAPTSFQLEDFACVAAFVACTHVMTHYYNEYFDYEADLANKQRGKWNGGSGVLPDGLLPPWVALAVANVLFVGSVVAQLAFFQGATRYVACITMLLSWGYTGPPVKLHYRCMGEATVAAVLTFCVPVMGALMQRHDDAFVLPTSLYAILPLLCTQQFVRMMIMNLPDIESDLQCGKVTLTAWLGPVWVARLYRIVQHAVGVISMGLFLCGYMLWPVLVAFLVASVKGVRLSHRLDSIVFADATATHKKNDDAPLDTETDTNVFGDLPFHATVHVASTALMLALAQGFLLAQTQLSLLRFE